MDKHTVRPPQSSKRSTTTEELFEYRSVKRSKLKLCLAITGIVMVVEVVGGFLTNSIALISDAGHMFTHFFALAISFGAIVCAGLPSCHHRTFGFYRAEILAALFNSLFLFFVSFWIIFEGVKRLIHPEPILSSQMFIIALIGLVVNIITALILHKASHHDLNIKGAFLHMMADTISSVVIVIAAIIIYYTGWYIIDPFVSIGIAAVILFWGWHLLKDSANILLQAAPKGITSDDISERLMAEFSEIDGIEDMRLWTITSNMHVMTAHIRLKEDVDRQRELEILAQVKGLVSEQFGIGYTTIELRRSGEG